MKPDIYLDATVSDLAIHCLVQTGFICASLLFSGGWTDPSAVYVPHAGGYAICEIRPDMGAAKPAKKDQAAEEVAITA